MIASRIPSGEQETSSNDGTCRDRRFEDSETCNVIVWVVFNTDVCEEIS